MTNRELFRRFYRAARVAERARAINAELRHGITKEAISSGFSRAAVLQVRAAALNARINSWLPMREPSKHSVAIQLSVHTFGRVTRGRA